jgi:hypothetical protein
MPTLPLSDIVSVSVILSPVAAVRKGFNLGLIVGDSAVIDTTERVRLYTDPSAMLSDGFTLESPEYAAATLYFSASPRPNKVAIGRWNSSGETALAAVTACREKNTDWYAFTVCDVTNAEILAIAAFTEAAQPSSAYFFTTSDAAVLAGTALTAGYETSGAAPSTDISAGSATTFKIAIDGDSTEHAVTLTVAGLNTGLLIAAAIQSEIREIGGIYAAVTVAFTGGVYVITSASKGIGSQVRVTNGDSNNVATVLKIGAANGATDTDGTGSIMLSLKGKSYSRTLGQYSTSTDAVAAIMGYAMGANTGLANSAYTLAYKREVGVTPDALTLTQVTTLKGQNCNIYINRGNTYNLFEQGVMANGQHFDEILGLDMLVNNIQLSVLDLLTGSTKVPQTEDGVALLASAINGPCLAARNTGFIAPGIWNAAPILSLNTGDTLSQGYLILSEPIDSQSQADRDARLAPPIYVPVKLAGAIEHVNIGIYVNR